VYTVNLVIQLGFLAFVCTALVWEPLYSDDLNYKTQD
jgi:hypothetical protein